MKKIVTLTAAMLMVVAMNAQSPEKMSFQSIIRTSGDELLVNHAIGLRISILQGTATGTVVYQETMTTETNDNGLVSVEIGNETGFNAIDWSDGPLFLKVETDPEGGSNYTITGTSQILSVPYALHAKNAENVTETQTLSDVLGNGNDGNAVRIKNIADPEEDQDAATKAYVDELLTMIEELKTLTTRVTDADGNMYSVVKLGSQLWLGENLKTTHYSDGTEIPHVIDTTLWKPMTTPAYTWYHNDTVKYKSIYGAIYNWYAVDTASNGNKNVCPAGWHVPDSTEWAELITFTGGAEVAGGKLKEAGTAHWNEPNTGATNETGFTAVAAGWLAAGIAQTIDMGVYACWWTTTSIDETTATYFETDYNNNGAYPYNWKKFCGFSVRCLKDQ